MKRIIRLAPLLISLTVFSTVVARAQSATTNKAPATIAGRVTLDGAGAPGAHVMLKPYVNDGFAGISFGVEQPPALSAVTDAEGRYRLTDVAPGAYRVSVFAPAHAVEGERDPLTPGKTINLAEGDNVEGLDFALASGAVITGKVTDDKDRPVIAAPPSPSWSQPSGEANEAGAFSIRGLKAGRYRLETPLPGADWYVKEMRLGGAPATSSDLARNGVTLKSGERLSGALITLGGGAAGLKGKVVAEGEARLPARMLAHLAPAEPEARDEALRFAETRVESDGLFSFNNLAPGKYWLLARPIPDSEPNDKPARPAAWDSAERAKLRREAEAANVVIELKPCQRLSDYVLRYGK